MNKIAIILLTLLIISGCSSVEEAPVSQESKQENKEQIIKEEVVLQNDKQGSSFNTKLPSIKRISTNEDLKVGFDSVYTEIFWNSTENNVPYNFPEVHSGEIEIGDTIYIDWSMIKPKPSEVSLMQVKKHSETVVESKVVEGEVVNIKIGENELGKQYAVQFLWKDGKTVTGKSMLNFRLEEEWLVECVLERMHG